ncbi:hypothetical protein ABH937_004254 [Kitasatospora sp. GAS1066B]
MPAALHDAWLRAKRASSSVTPPDGVPVEVEPGVALFGPIDQLVGDVVDGPAMASTL